MLAGDARTDADGAESEAGLAGFEADVFDLLELIAADEIAVSPARWNMDAMA